MEEEKEIKSEEKKENPELGLTPEQEAILKKERYKLMKKRIRQRYYMNRGAQTKKEYYLKNKDKIKERAKQYAMTPEAKEKRKNYMKEYMKGYYQRNKDKVKEMVKKSQEKKEENVQ